MSANSFGHRFKITTFGESHGVAYGVVIDGCPAGLTFDHELLKRNLEKRKPGQGNHTTARAESDQPEILSGVYDGITLGTPIAIIVKNENARSADYDVLKSSSRNGHADDVWQSKFGFKDHRGGGRSSGRETLCRVIGGSVAQMLLQSQYPDLQIHAYASQIAHFILDIKSVDLPEDIKLFLSEAKVKGESYGGVVTCDIANPPENLGQPVFHKLKSDLAAAIMSIGAVTGFELGSGFSVVEQKGTDFHKNTQSENYGGIRGGISTGETISFKVAFKPTSSIMDVAKKGRHDPCIVPRAIPVVEAMSWLVLADHWLWSKSDKV